jgi:hypothetical protein
VALLFARSPGGLFPLGSLDPDAAYAEAIALKIVFATPAGGKRMQEPSG